MLSISGALSASYSYDANGNMNFGAGRSVSWTAANMVSSIAEGTTTIGYVYDTEHQRVIQTGSSAGNTAYFSDPGTGIRAEQVTNSGGTLLQWNDYLFAGGEMVGVHFEFPPTNTTSDRYYHKDHLGSVAVLTDDTGAVQQRLSYDAWGKRRNADGSDAPGGISPPAQTTRGFTGHEEIDDVGLVNMNARIYDPAIGRFMSADPQISVIYNLQILNRYSYVGNNPLSFTDPSGNCFLGCFWKKWLKQPIVRDVLAIAASYLLGPGGSWALFGPDWANIAFAGGIAGGIQSGSVKGIVIGVITAEAFYEVGTATGAHFGPNSGNAEYRWATANPDLYAENVLGHAAVGCLSSMAGGGKCGSGALAAGFADAVGPAMSKLDLDDAGKLVSTSVVGGVGSVLGGGKFGNGAVTAAFGYLFNEMGNNAQRGYAATSYSDGTVCNGGTADPCIMEGATPYYGFEKFAIGIIAPFTRPFIAAYDFLSGLTPAVPESNGYTQQYITRPTPGADGGVSTHVIESLDGDTVSVTHQVDVDGEIVHQHQTYIGKYGSQRQFPPEWQAHPDIDR